LHNLNTSLNGTPVAPIVIVGGFDAQPQLEVHPAYHAGGELIYV